MTNSDDKKELKEKKEKKRRIRKNKEPKEAADQARSKNTIFVLETLAITVLSICMIALLLNKTFFREEYETNDFKIKIPMLYYFVSDKDGIIEFKTLRKSDYDREYFDDYLNDLDRYTCKGKSFYYDSKNKLAIYNIKVEKKIAIKTIKINYEILDINKICY